MNITLPNGVEIKGIPDGTSRESIKEKAIAKGVAKEGDFTPVKPKTKEKSFFKTVSDAFTGKDRMTSTIKGMDDYPAAPEMNEWSWDSFQADLGGMLTGEDDEIQAIFKKQFGDKVSFRKDKKNNVIVKFPSGEYTLNSPGVSGSDIRRLGFQIPAYALGGLEMAGAKLGLGSFLKAGAKTALKEGLIETAMEGGETALGGNFDPADITEAAALGAGGKALEKVGTSAFDIYKSIRAKNLPDSPADDIVRQGQQFNVPVMTSDVLPPESTLTQALSDASEKLPVIGTSAERAAQQQARQSAVNKMLRGKTSFSDQDIITSLKNSRSATKKQAGGVLENIGQQLDPLEKFPLNKTIDAIQEARKQILDPRVIQNKNSSGALDALLQALRGQKQTFSTLKQNKTSFRELLEGIDPAAKAQMGSNEKRLLSKIERAMKEDMDIQAKSNLTEVDYNKWKEANKQYGKMATDLKETRLKNVLNKGDITPEDYRSMLFSNKPSESKILYRNLTEKGQESSRSAILKEMETLSQDITGEISPDKFSTLLKKPRIKNAIESFFPGDDGLAIKGLGRLLDKTRQAQRASQITATGQSLYMPLAAAGGVGGAVVAPQITGAAISVILANKLYNKPVVRDLLIRVNKVKRGSAREKLLFSEINNIIAATAQASRE